VTIFNTASTTSAKFEQIGATLIGTVTEISDLRQATKFGTNDPDFWPSGEPIMQVVVTLQTDERDPADEHDRGVRNLYVTVSFKEGGQLWAIKQALKAAGAEDLEVGGKLALRYVGNDPESKNPANPRKVYEARYQLPPAGGGMFTEQVNTSTGEITRQQQAPSMAQAQQNLAQGLGATPMQQPAAAPQQQAPQDWMTGAAPAAAPAPAAAAPQVDMAKVKQLLALGLPDQAIAIAAGTTEEAVAAIRNMP
jgi:hypothetical protein